jgi:hypothetical protein
MTRLFVVTALFLGMLASDAGAQQQRWMFSAYNMTTREFVNVGPYATRHECDVSRHNYMMRENFRNVTECVQT